VHSLRRHDSGRVDLSQQAASETLPLRDAFAVLFFVSVGMLFDPSILMREPAPVIATFLVIVAGNALVVFGIVASFRYSLRSALTLAASLSQIGEFSFILAGLGVELKLLPETGRDLILAGALPRSWQIRCYSSSSIASAPG
jgi:CPA2 family monovalent cation:H+ antiporter-2